MRFLVKRPGNTLHLVAGSMAVLLGAAAWVVDLGNGYLARTRMQNATDSAALAGVAQMASGGSSTDAANQASSWAGQNGVTVGSGDVSSWTTAGGAPAVTVHANETVKTTFGAVIGIPSFNVAAVSSATVGGLTQIPRGCLPFAVPAYQCGSDWYALCDNAGHYALLTVDPRRGGPPTLELKVGSGCSSTGNFLPLSLDGTGASNYRSNIMNGVAEAIAYGSIVNTETGNMVGPTAQGVRDRLAQGAAYAEIYVPMIAKSAWDNLNGKSSVTLIGFLNARLNPVLNGSQVTATFESRAISLPGSVGVNQSPGAYSPILIPTP